MEFSNDDKTPRFEFTDFTIARHADQSYSLGEKNAKTTPKFRRQSPIQPLKTGLPDSKLVLAIYHGAGISSIACKRPKVRHLAAITLFIFCAGIGPTPQNSTLAFPVQVGPTPATTTVRPSNTDKPDESTASFGTEWPDGQADRIFIERLLDSQLFDLAIEICLRRIESYPQERFTNLRTQWTMLWMESLARKQIATPRTFLDAPEVNQGVFDAIIQVNRAENAGPRGAWLDYKLAWTRWLITRSCVAAYLATPNRATLRDWSLEQIRTTLEEIEILIAKTQSVATSPQSAAPNSPPTATEISSLLAEARLLACEVLDLRASLYAEDAEERIACGTQMLKLLDSAERLIGADWNERFKIELSRAKAHLWLGQPRLTLEIAEAFYNQPSTTAARDEASTAMAAIAAQASRESGSTDQARQWIEKVGGWKTAPTLAIEHLTLELKNSNFGPDERLANAFAIKKEIEARFGVYWSQRADAVLVAANSGSNLPATQDQPSSSTSIELLRTEAKQFIAGKQWNAAIEKLQQAEAAASRQRDIDGALSFALQSAALWGIQGEHATAGNEFFRAAKTYADSPAAPKAASHAISMLQEAIRIHIGSEEVDDPTERSASIEELVALRTEIWQHIAVRWPGTQEAQQAAQLLGEHFIATDQIWEACEFWLAIWAMAAKTETTSGPKSADEMQTTASSHALSTLRLTGWLSAQQWMDSDVIGIDTDRRWNAMADKARGLAAENAGWRATFEDIEKLTQGYGWEYKHDSLDDAFTEHWFGSWIAAHVASSHIANGSTQASSYQVLERLTDELSQQLHELSGPPSRLRLMATRSVQMFRLQLATNPAESAPGVQQAALSELLRTEEANVRDPWWAFHAARIYETVPSETVRAERRFWQLGSSLPSGSAGWLECRARSVQLLRAQGKTEEANRLAKNVEALTPSLSNAWKSRLHK